MEVSLSRPVPVLDPLLSWANEAPCGLSFKRLLLQLQGRIQKKNYKEEKLKIDTDIDADIRRSGSVSPPPAPIASKKRRLLDDESEEYEEVVKKLEDDFDLDEGDDDVRKSGPPAPIALKRRRSLALLDEYKEVVKKLEDDFDRDEDDDGVRNSGRSKSVSPPPALIASKKRRLLALLDDSGEYKEETRRLVRKLEDDFDRDEGDYVA